MSDSKHGTAGCGIMVQAQPEVLVPLGNGLHLEVPEVRQQYEALLARISAIPPTQRPNRIILSHNADGPATRWFVEELDGLGVEVWRVPLPPGLDPISRVIREEGVNGYLRRQTQAVRLLPVRFDDKEGT